MIWQFIKSVLGSKGNGTVVKEVSKQVDDLIFTKEEKEQLKKELIEKFLNDLRSARELQMEALRQSDVFSKRFLYYLAISIVALSFILFYILLFYDLPAEKENIIYALLGWVGGVLTQVVSFFFGSSLGSKLKDKREKDVL